MISKISQYNISRTFDNICILEVRSTFNYVQFQERVPTISRYNQGSRSLRPTPVSIQARPEVAVPPALRAAAAAPAPPPRDEVAPFRDPDAITLANAGGFVFPEGGCEDLRALAGSPGSWVHLYRLPVFSLARAKARRSGRLLLMLTSAQEDT